MMEGRLAASDQSLNANVGENGEEEWQDFIADDRPLPEQFVLGVVDREIRSTWLGEAMGSLSDRERTIISERRLKDDAVTLEELGKELGISKERVRQIEHKALEKLRGLLSRQVDNVMDMIPDA